MRKISLPFMALLLMCLSGPAYSFGDKHGEGKGGKFREVLKQLDLTQEQIDTLKEHRKANKTKERPDWKKTKQLKEDIKIAFINGASDEQIKDLNSKLQAEQEKMKEARFSKMIFMKNLLNQEQRKKFMDMKKDRRHKED